MTVPGAQPSAAAVSSTSRSCRKRGTSTARCLGGSAEISSHGTTRSSRSGCATGASGTEPTPDSRRHHARTQVLVLVEPRPRHVELGERGLRQVLGAVPVPAEQVGGHADRIHVPGESTR